MSDKDNARSSDRQPYTGPVWLKPEEGASLVGDVRNVSRGGMFVNVVPTPPIGEEVLCELPGFRALRGRVVWISSPAELADHGVGIEFVDLSEKNTPILAMPSTTYAGIELQGPLDFLAEGAEVHLAAPNGHRQLRARVADVVMDHAGGATHLALSLVISPAVTPPLLADADEAWFPEITIDPPRIATPILDGPVVDASPEPKAAVLEAIEPESSDRELVTALSRRDSQLDDTLALAPGTTDDTERTYVATPLPLPEKPRARVFVPFAAVTGLILVGLALLRVGVPATEQPAPLPVAPIPTHVAEAAAPAPAVWTKTAAPEPEPELAPAHVAPAHVAAPVTASATVDAATWKADVSQSKGEPSVLVPLRGSAKGMTSFTLDQPNGIAVVLPNAQLAVTAKSYLLHHPLFTSLWVRQMDKGLQIRLHATKGVKLEAVLEDGALRIRKQ